MEQTPVIDHNLLIDSIISQGGVIVGGYVRAWVSNGSPCDEGWDDIDCMFPNIESANLAINNIQKLFGDKAPQIDLRSCNFAKTSVIKNIKLISLKFNTFYSSCWAFDGQIKLLEPALTHKSFDEILYQTKNKIAQCILPFQFYKKSQRQIKKMLKYGWTIVDTEGKEIPKEYLLKIVKNFKSVYYPNKTLTSQ